MDIDTSREEIVAVGVDAAKVIDEAHEIAELPPKREPSRHRHLVVEESVGPTIVEQVLGSVKAENVDDLKTRMLARLGYTDAEYAKLEGRVNRWKRNKAGTAHRMPGHIKAKATIVHLVEAAVREFQAPKPQEDGLLAKAGKGLKKLAADFVSEVKAQQA